METNDNFNRIVEMNTEAERRRIAAMAMQVVVISSKRNHNLRISDSEIEGWAKDSVRIADALIAELNKKKDRN